MQRRHWLTLTTASCLALAFAACQPAGDETTMDQEPEESGAEATAAEGGHMEGVSVTLVPKNESGMAGTAIVREAPGDSMDVSLKLSGLSAGQDYPAHVHRGTCNSPGPVTAALESVTAGADTASSRGTVPDPRVESPGGDFLIQVHLPDGTPAACGMIPAHREGPSVDTTAG